MNEFTSLRVSYQSGPSSFRLPNIPLQFIRMEKIHRHIKQDAIILGNEGKTQAEIKEILGISVSAIQRAKYKQRDHGDVEGGAKKRGPKPKLSVDLEDVALSRRR